MQSIERLSPSFEARIEKVISQTPCLHLQSKAPARDVHQSAKSLSTPPSRDLSEAANRHSRAVEPTPPCEDPPAAQSPRSHASTEVRNAGLTTPSHTSPPPATPGDHEFNDPPESASLREKSPVYSRETPGLFEDADDSGEVRQLSTSVPNDAPSPVPSSNKRPHEGNDDAVSKESNACGGDRGTASDPKPKKPKSQRKPRRNAAADIAAHIGHLVRKGGDRLLQDFETWNSDLALLRPDREQLTLKALGQQQCIYTEKLLQSSAVAQVIHSCCVIAYEHQKSIQDRHGKVRRSQHEIRASNRLRTLGTIFVEAIKQLAAKIGEKAYLLLTAVSGKNNKRH